MGTLTFVGLGLGDRGISVAGLRAIQESDVAYLEYYTTPHAPALLHELESASGRTMVVVDRTYVEDGKKILQDAAEKMVVLAVQGDPMIATTHSDLRVRAISRGIATSIVHGATIASAAASASGLHYYKFGATVTFTRGGANKQKDHHLQVYQRVHHNILQGSHTLLLLEWDTERDSGVEPRQVIEDLLDAERSFKRQVFGEETFAVVLSRVGTPEEKIAAGTFAVLRGQEFGAPPHVVIIPGSMHFSEREALAAFAGLDAEHVGDNAAVVRRTAQVLIPRYVEKAKKVLQAARGSLKEGYDDLFENTELYIRDADNFLANGQDELAMLSIGYAEGLIDSLTFTGKLKIEW